MRSFSLPERMALIVELERRLTVQDGVHLVQVPRLVDVAKRSRLSTQLFVSTLLDAAAPQIRL